MSATVEEVRQMLLDPHRFAEVSARFARDSTIAATEELGDVVTSLVREFCACQIRSQIAAVTKVSQSPIEMIFLNSLALCFLQTCFPMIVLLTRKDILAEILEMRAHLDHLAEFMAWFRETYPSDNGTKSLREYFDDQIAQGRIQCEEASNIFQDSITYDLLPGRELIHCSPQAPMPTVRVDGRGIRVDALFWIPEKPDKKVVLECDGYEFHGSRDSFTSDRKRDRALGDMGINVVRFSGREIMEDPAGVAYEMHKRLYAELQPSYFRASKER